MALFKIEDLSFTYAGEKEPALKNISLETQKGETIAVIGESGSGKTTLLRLLKKIISPKGELSGSISFSGSDEISEIGFVFQDPCDQSVCETVYEELCFAPQNLNISPDAIRVKAAEACAFFGISDLISKKISELSGGEVQTVNLAAAAVLSPKVIILDEPFSQLDPISIQKLISSLRKLKDELGTSIIISSHSIEGILPFIDKIAVLENGELSLFGDSDNVIKALIHKKNPLALTCGALPLISKENILKTVKEARDYLYRNNIPFSSFKNQTAVSGETLIKAKNIYMRYDKRSEDILKGVSVEIKKGEVLGLCGANGSGKTTLLSVLSGALKSYSGKVRSCGDVLYIPQDPRIAFVKDTVLDDIKFMCDVSGMPYSMLDSVISSYPLFKDADKILNKHPYDLSGGELQKAVVLKALTADKDILLFDEPVKGLDPKSKAEFEKMIMSIRGEKAIAIASHDIEFLTRVCSDIAMLFGGEIITKQPIENFVTQNSYFTTSLVRASKGIKEGLIVSTQLWGEL